MLRYCLDTIQADTLFLLTGQLLLTAFCAIWAFLIISSLLMLLQVTLQRCPAWESLATEGTAYSHPACPTHTPPPALRVQSLVVFQGHAVGTGLGAGRTAILACLMAAPMV